MGKGSRAACNTITEKRQRQDVLKNRRVPYKPVRDGHRMVDREYKTRRHISRTSFLLRCFFFFFQNAWPRLMTSNNCCIRGYRTMCRTCRNCRSKCLRSKKSTHSVYHCLLVFLFAISYAIPIPHK